MMNKNENSDIGLLATRELSTPLQIAEQSSTAGTHFEQTSSLADARLRSGQNPQNPCGAMLSGGQLSKQIKETSKFAEETTCHYSACQAIQKEIKEQPKNTLPDFLNNIGSEEKLSE